MLDVETADSLDRLAKGWQVSKSEALRRSVKAAATVEAVDASSDALRALTQLQDRLGLDTDKAQEWVQQIRAQRSEDG